MIQKNIFWLGLDRFIKIIVGVVVGGWVARYLGPSNLGILNFATLLGYIAGGYLQGAYKNLIISQIAKSTNRNESLVLNNYYFQLILLSGIGYSLLIALAIISSNRTQGWMYIIIGFQVLFNPIWVIKYFFEAAGNFKEIVIIENTGFIISAATKVYFILNQYQILMIGIAFASEQVIYTLLYILYFRQKKYSMRNTLLFQLNKTTILNNQGYQTALPLVLTALISIFYSKIDQLITGVYLDKASFAIFSVAARLNELGALIPSIFASATYPRLVYFFEHSKDSFYELIEKALSITLYTSIVFIVAVYFLSPIAINLIYGGSYSRSALILKILSMSLVTTSIGHYWSMWIVLERRGSALLIANTLCCSLSGVFAYLLARKYGPIGVGISTTVSFILSALIGFLLYKPKIIFKILFRSAFVIPRDYFSRLVRFI